MSGNKYWHNPTVGQGPHFMLKDRHNDMEAEACMAVMRNAFSDATTNPRVPDGKASESVGFRKKLMAEIEQDETNPIEILFFAGLNTCLVMRNGRFNSANGDSDMSTVKYMRLDDHVVVENVDGAIFTPPVDVQENQAIWHQPTAQQLCKWRPVSYGLLLSLVNSSEYNEGWWEAIRVNMCDNVNMFSFIKEQESEGVDKGTQPMLFVPDVPSISSNQMLGNQSYSTGKLRNISQVVFQLNPEIRDYDFNKVHDAILVEGDRRYTAQHNDQDINRRNQAYPLKHWDNQITPMGYSIPSMNDPINGTIDRNYDAIYIRLHGVKGAPRAGSGTSTGQRGSVLTALAVINQELVYGDASKMQLFHGRSPDGQFLLRQLKHNNMQAGTVYNLAQIRSYHPGYSGPGRTYLRGYNTGGYGKRRTGRNVLKSPYPSYSKSRSAPKKRSSSKRRKAPSRRRRR